MPLLWTQPFLPRAAPSQLGRGCPRSSEPATCGRSQSSCASTPKRWPPPSPASRARSCRWRASRERGEGRGRGGGGEGGAGGGGGGGMTPPPPNQRKKGAGGARRLEGAVL